MKRSPSGPRSLWAEAALTAVVCLAYLATTERLSEDLRALGLVLLFALIVAGTGAARAWLPWVAMVAILTLGIASRPFDVPNHHFVLTYLTVAMALALSAGPDDAAEVLRWNGRWLIVVIMGFATLHRLLSDDFMDGSYVGYMIATGGFVGPLLQKCGACADAVAGNVQLITEFRASPPSPDLGVQLTSPVPALPVATGIMTGIILSIEALIFVVFLWRPTGRIAHFTLLAFAVVLGLVRQEFMFISVLSVLGYLSCPRDLGWLRFGYAGAALVFAAGAMT